jgi:hypothetical protein
VDPVHSRSFTTMWSAQFVSNVGGWMQTIAAQWLMISLTTSGPTRQVQTLTDPKHSTKVTHWLTPHLEHVPDVRGTQ